MKICLKELRETLICLKIIYNKPLIEPTEKVNAAILETDELISIFVTSINTANRKKLNEEH
jgi:four helix bundle protein